MSKGLEIVKRLEIALVINTVPSLHSFMENLLLSLKILRTPDISKGFEISKELEIQKKTRDCFNIQNSHGFSFTYVKVYSLAYIFSGLKIFLKVSKCEKESKSKKRVEIAIESNALRVLR